MDEVAAVLLRDGVGDWLPLAGVPLTLSAALTAFSTYFSGVLPAPAWLLHTSNALISFLIITALIAAILKYVPDVKVRWRDVWEGAAATALLFTLGKALIGLYLGKAAVGSAYGAAGSLVVVIVWVYYSAMIFYFGVEFTRVCASPAARHRARKSLDLGTGISMSTSHNA